VFVEFIITPGLMVSGDVQLLRVVLEYLLGNAWKFTGEQPQTTIECGCTSNNGNPIFYVRDNGVGLKQVVSPFYTLIQ
jgi:signal transduction histidine kinase